MKTDLYTKAVLTVIAISLSIIAFRNFDVIPTATANPKKFVSVPLNEDGSMNVVVNKLPAEMEVKITSVDYDAFERVSSSYPLKVKVIN